MGNNRAGIERSRPKRHFNNGSSPESVDRRGRSQYRILNTSSAPAPRELFDHCFEIGEARAEQNLADAIPTSGGDGRAIRYDIELAALVRRLEDGVNIQVLLDQGGETRRLLLGAASGCAVLNLDLHSGAEPTTVPRGSLSTTCAATHYRAGSHQIRSRQS